MTYRVHKTFTLDDNNSFDREEMSLTFTPSCVGDLLVDLDDDDGQIVRLCFCKDDVPALIKYLSENFGK